jgi:pimeloyl-ACP methyl ester carboxylesterase
MADSGRSVPTLAAMQAAFVSRYADVAGHPVHVADFGGSGPPIVCLHGLGGSHVNWLSLAPALAKMGSVTAPDLPGFGLSPPGRSSTMTTHRVLLDEYLKGLREPALLVGNSMGATLALLLAAQRPGSVRGLVLLSPAVPPAPRTSIDAQVAALFALYLLPGAASLVLGGRRRLQDPESIARFTLELCTARASRVDPEVFRAHVEVAERRSHLAGVDRAFVETARSLLSLLLGRLAFERSVASVTAPTLLIHGRDDRLVKVAWAERVAAVRPDWELELFDDVGHVPMLEVPAATAAAIGAWPTLERAA